MDYACMDIVWLGWFLEGQNKMEGRLGLFV